MFREDILPVQSLPMKGKRKPNGHHEKRGRQTFKRHISERTVEFTDFDKEFGHLKGDTIVGRRHGSAVITLVERVFKMIVTLRPEGRKAFDIEKPLNSMFSTLPYRLFKSITFDCGKEFSSWKSISNQHDISIFLLIQAHLRSVFLSNIQMICLEETVWTKIWISTQLQTIILFKLHIPSIIGQENLLVTGHH